MKLVISGTTGVGKSTTVSLLKERLEAKGRKVVVVGEMVVASPYFDYFFNDMASWGFLAQLDWVLERYKHFIEIESIAEKNKDTIYIFDRHFLDDKIFSELFWVKQNLSSFQSNAYKYVFDMLVRQNKTLKKEIDYFILLKADFEVVQERMKIRGRDQEEKFNIKFWKDLYWRYYSSSEYKKMFKSNTNNFLELITSDKNPSQVVDAIVKYISKRSKKI